VLTAAQQYFNIQATTAAEAQAQGIVITPEQVAAYVAQAPPPTPE
jgi:hypothetical protein